MINLTSRYPAILAVLFLIISAAVSFYFYRKTSLPNLKKYIFINLKTLAIFLLLILLLEPSLLALITKSSKPVNIVIVDNSRSNDLLSEDGKVKSSVINDFLNEGIFKGDNYKLYTLSDSVNQPQIINYNDSVKYNIAETDLSDALSKIISYLPDRNFGTVTVISDGIFNAGGNPLYPARTFQAPFITIGIGDTIRKRDAVLSDVYYESKAFTETNNIIRAHINAYLLPNENLEINLLREGIVIQTKELAISNNQQSDDLEFSIRESNPGSVKYSVEILQVPGEVTYRNNHTQFLIHYTDNKTNILYISAGPGYDNTAVLDILKRVNNFKVTEKTVKSANEFYESPIDFKAFGEYSIVFLLGFPISQFSNDITSQIALKVKELNIPVIFFAQKKTDYKKLEMFDRSIPFTVLRFNQSESEFNPLVVSVTDNVFSKIQGEINSKPPVFKNISGIVQKSGTVTMMTDKTTGEPIFITQSSPKNKSSAFLGYGLWRWNLNPKSGNEKTLENFIIESVNLTLLHEKKTKFKVYPVKDVNDYSEKINFNAEVYDDEYKPIRNAKVTGRVLAQNGSTFYNNIVFSITDNKYTASIPPLAYGDYSIEAESEVNGSTYASDKSRFLVDSVNTEYLITKSNFDNLKELSQNTGGKFFSSSTDKSEITSAINTLSEHEISENQSSVKKRYNLWENKYIMLLIILLFSAEWVLRKRNNLP